MGPSEKLCQDFEQNPHMRYVTRESPDYLELRSTWYECEGATPLGIARPGNAQDVAEIVAFVVSNNVPFAVRSGGHDSWSRGFAAEALTIDMRNIDYVHVDGYNTSARIGGGILAPGSLRSSETDRGYFGQTEKS